MNSDSQKVNGEKITVNDQQNSTDNRLPVQEPKFCNVTKLTKTSDELKLNNNVPLNADKCSTSNEAQVKLSNGLPSGKNVETHCSSENGHFSDTSNLSPTYTGLNLRFQSSNNSSTSHVNHKSTVFTSNLNLPQDNQMILPMISNEYSSIMSCPNEESNSRKVNSCETTEERLTFSNVLSVNSSEDRDMRNNVDYTSEIEKCPPKVSCSSDSSPEMENKWSSKSVLNNISGSIGSTNQGTCFLRHNINGCKDVAGPSGLQKTAQRTANESRDSSSGNEGDLSDEEDQYIYTYKGDDEDNAEDDDDENRLDFRQDLNHIRRQELAGHESDRSSPEMDFLEMDFNPGPSCETDTGDSDMASINEDIQNISLDNMEGESNLLNDLSNAKVVSRQEILQIQVLPRQEIMRNSQENNPIEINVKHETSECQASTSRNSNDVDKSWLPGTSTSVSISKKSEATGLHRSGGCPLQESYGYHNTSGDLISPVESREVDAEFWSNNASTSSSDNSRKVNLSSTLYHRMMAKKLMLNKQTNFNQSSESNLESELCDERLDGLPPIEKLMHWSEQEAAVKQVTQIATSACGATAAVNAIMALDVPFSLEVLVKGVATRLREPGTPLPRYLQSRSLAGATHKDIERGIHLATNGALGTKFFAFYPERKVSLSHWLHHWMSRGAIPIATLNLQHCGEGCNIPDSWHHQMIFGVGPAGIFLTNPLQCLPEQILRHQIVSPSVLLIRRADVLAHWNPTTDLSAMKSFDHRWRKLNVLGQVVNMIRETMGERNCTSASHVRIPASYQAGITLVVHSDSEVAKELANAEQLPLL